MIAVVQRVGKAAVSVGGEEKARIGPGMLVLVGVERGDTPADAEFLARKAAGLRMFDDQSGRMNLSVSDVQGGILAVSQFTLAADCARGRRPSFDNAAPPEAALPLFEAFVAGVRASGVPVRTGVFQAMMEVELVNSGPATFILRSRPGPGRDQA